MGLNAPAGNGIWKIGIGDDPRLAIPILEELEWQTEQTR